VWCGVAYNSKSYKASWGERSRNWERRASTNMSNEWLKVDSYSAHFSCNSMICFVSRFRLSSGLRIQTHLSGLFPPILPLSQRF
jgi:hypothetical protein